MMDVPTPAPAIRSASGLPEPPGAPGPSLTSRTARGFAWLLSQTVVERLVTAFGQLALAWLLQPSDYKLLALVYTVTTFGGLLQQAGLGQVLVQRHARFVRWATPTFWMALAFGCLAAVLTAAVSPLVARFYQQPALTGLLLVGALSMPLNGLCVVPDAMLRAQMRFRLLAMTGAGVTAGTILMSVVLAWAGFGAYSFILPQPVGLTAKAIVLWSAARTRVRPHPRLRRWRMLIGDSGPVLIATLAMTTSYLGDWIVLGRLYRNEPVVGYYYFALSMADQASRAFVVNLSGALFPALATLANDAQRQTRAFLRAATTLSLLVVPVSILQAVLAGPLFRVFFPDRLAPAIPIFAIISIAMLGRQIHSPTESMMLAQRRQRTAMTIALIYAPCFLALVLLSARHFGAIGVAAAVAASALVLGPIELRIAVGAGGGTWADVFQVFRVPLLGSALSIGPAMLATLVFPRTRVGDALALVLVSGLYAGVYAMVVRALAPAEWEQLASMLGAFVRRLRRVPDADSRPSPDGGAEDALRPRR